MDGLTISSAEGLLKSGKTTSELRSESLFKPAEGQKGSPSFSDSLTKAVNEVNQLQHQSDVMIEKLSTGETKNIPEVMIAVEKADIALKLMVQVRNKMIEAYQEIMKMQV